MDGGVEVEGCGLCVVVSVGPVAPLQSELFSFAGSVQSILRPVLFEPPLFGVVVPLEGVVEVESVVVEPESARRIVLSVVPLLL